MRPVVSVGVFVASMAASWPALADPLRILIAVSHSRGAPGELPLVHAAEDAEHVRDVLTSLGGFHESRVHLDIETDDLDAEVKRLVALGANEVERNKYGQADGYWVVMQAPTGQRFCVGRPKTKDFPANANRWELRKVTRRPPSERCISYSASRIVLHR